MKIRSTCIFVLLLYYVLLTACDRMDYEEQVNTIPPYAQKTDFAYNLQAPGKKMFLPYELEEISGITYFGGDQLACVQDEKGLVYTYDVERDKIISRFRFDEDGDYEGVALANGFIYVAKSNGNIYEIKIDGTPESTTKYKTPLSIHNDIEGLCLDSANNRLLVACKGQPGISKEGDDKEQDEDKRAVYAFDLKTKQLNETPVFLISIGEIEQYLASRGQKWRKGILGPSGIAIHPITSNIYILSHLGRLLIILKPDGSLKSVQVLKGSMYRQPEGIAFAPNGDMFISNEGDGGRGSILRFKYLGE